MSATFDVKAILKQTKLNPVQKLGMSNRFRTREFPVATDNDNIYEVAFGQNIINIRAAENGVNPDEMDIIADILQRGRKNEQKAMIDMLMIIHLLPLAQETVDTLTAEWRENGVESKLIKGPLFEQPETVTP